MRLMVSAPLAAALLCLVAPSAARAAENLDCMESGYSEAGWATIEAFIAGFDFRRPNAPAPAYQAVLSARAEACAAEHGWSTDAKTVALQYRRAAFMDAALRRHAPVSPEAIERMEAALAATDEGQVWQAFLRLAAQRRQDKQANVGALELGVLMPILDAAGLEHNYESGQFIGAWITVHQVKRDLSARFATL